MNPSDRRLDRLLEAAQGSREPIPHPSPWFEQRVILALKEEAIPLSGLIDGGLIFRFLIGAAGLMALSIILASVQINNPYIETIELANTTAQLEKIQ